MPIYEYRCKACGSVNEYLVRSAANASELACTSCGSNDMSRMISPVSFTVKGHAHAHGEACCGRGDCEATAGCAPGGCCSQ